VNPQPLPEPSWARRAQQLGAVPMAAAAGLQRLAALWPAARLAPALDATALQRLSAQVSFVQVGAGRTLIEQGEAGHFLLVLLDGSVGIERHADARPGDVLGEMALLDAGPRGNACVTRTSCTLAVLEMDALARLMQDDQPLALTLMAALARRLSLRLRQTDARLSALLCDD
jgi:CRP/FNR family cyclic AMP-dependent transcriptional regulator